MARVPLLSGSRIPLVTVGDDAVLLAPPPPLDPLRDVTAAVREALRYPLSGPPLADLVTRGGRVTIVVEPRSLPLPGAPSDPRPGGARRRHRRARAARDAGRQADDPRRRRPRAPLGHRELEAVLRPIRARAFRGAVVVHDAASSDLRPIELDGAPPVRIHGSLLADRPGRVCHRGRDLPNGGPARSSRPVRPRRSPRWGRRGRSSRRRSRPPASSPAGSRLRSDAVRPSRRLARARPSAPDGAYRDYPCSPQAIAALSRSRSGGS